MQEVLDLLSIRCVEVCTQLCAPWTRRLWRAARAVLYIAHEGRSPLRLVLESIDQQTSALARGSSPIDAVQLHSPLLQLMRMLILAALTLMPPSPPHSFIFMAVYRLSPNFFPRHITAASSLLFDYDSPVVAAAAAAADDGC